MLPAFTGDSVGKRKKQEVTKSHKIAIIAENCLVGREEREER
jgi:hypothetical protein